MKRYYYKTTDGKSFLNLKAPLVNEPNVIEITEQEFIEATAPKELTEEQIALQNKQKLIAENEALLRKYKYDVEQVDLFGMQRDDYEQKKELCKQLVLELRELEK